MTIVTEAIVNQRIDCPFVSTSNITGLTSFPNVSIIKDNSVVILTVTYVEVGSGLYIASFTPTATGLYTLFIESRIQGTFKVVTRSMYSFLQNVEDTAMGSWTWNKNTGVLIFLRQDGTTLAGFNVVDTASTASRERSTP